MDREAILQLRFEQIIDILILYKQAHPKEDVYLTEKFSKEAVKWYQDTFKDRLN